MPRLNAHSSRTRAVLVALLLGAAVLAAVAGWALTDFADYADARAAPDAYLFWSLAFAWPALSAALVIYRRKAQPPVGAAASWAWWIAMAWLPWSWVAMAFLPDGWGRGASGLPAWLRGPSWTTIHLAAAAGVLTLLVWLWRTRRPPV